VDGRRGAFPQDPCPHRKGTPGDTWPGLSGGNSRWLEDPTPLNVSPQRLYGDESLRDAIVAGTGFYLLPSARLLLNSRWIEGDWEGWADRGAPGPRIMATFDH